MKGTPELGAMTISLDLPSELENELSAEASQLKLPLCYLQPHNLPSPLGISTFCSTDHLCNIPVSI
ncbi:hypothetical protein C7293_14775 [filamentous cyanobacterium CCT1]|nr:hypothetical protein C7293_14775 [filamentous cyanobacterium CCT1]PSN80359.1 hypothetical protein C8B47_06920 [filamentous cyanobacterium CCP4]